MMTFWWLIALNLAFTQHLRYIITNSWEESQGMTQELFLNLDEVVQGAMFPPLVVQFTLKMSWHLFLRIPKNRELQVLCVYKPFKRTLCVFETV